MWTNILHNAIDALGTITIATRREKSCAVVGKGTGLGLEAARGSSSTATTGR